MEKMIEVMKGYLAIIVLGFLTSFTVYSQEKDQVAGEIIVQLAEDIKIPTFIDKFNQTRLAALPNIDAKKILSSTFNIHLLSFNPDLGSEILLNSIRQHPLVKAAQFNYQVYTRSTPNDARYDQQWDSHIIQAREAWDFTTGGLTALGDTIVVAILDNGFDIDHEDLADNIWRNRHEIPNDGLDNDNNGFVDDIMGWNFLDQSPNLPSQSHGNSVAGIIGAKGNNEIGIAGLNWDIKLMLFATGFVSEIIVAYDYIIEQRRRYNQTEGNEGAFVVATNFSLGQDNRFCRDQPVWGGMYDLLGQVGILTGAATTNNNVNVETSGDMPSTCTSPYLLTTTNTTSDDRKFGEAGFGVESVDIGAPGEESLSIKPNDRYGLFFSNSAAAPHLTGAIALLFSSPCESFARDAVNNPATTALYVRDAILNGVDQLSTLEGKTVTGGRLNVFNSMRIILDDCNLFQTGALEIINIFPNPTSDKVTIEYETPDFGEYEMTVSNALGQTVYSNTVNPNSLGNKRLDIEVHNFMAGVYFVQLRRENDIQTKAFVVQ